MSADLWQQWTESTPAPLLIGGDRVMGGGSDSFPCVNPSTGECIAHAVAGTSADIDEAIGAARDAFGGWGTLAPVERGRMLWRIADAIRERRESLAYLDAVDAGLPLWMGRADVDNAARYFEFFAGAADKIYGDSIPLGPGSIDFTAREPYGACGVITPFNVPLQMVARSVAPALAAGNTVVAKPGEQSALPAIALGELMLECGLPAGVVNVISGVGPETGAALAAHPGQDHLTFTGSLAVGREVAAAAARQMTPMTIEAGGKSPQVVFADADVDVAITSIIGSAIRTAGQVCSAGTRVLIEDAAYDQVAGELVRRTEALETGRAVDEPDVGPLVSKAQQTRVLASIESAAAAGVEVLTGGGAPSSGPLAGGFFVEPTIFGEVDPDSDIVREEVFGPVLTLQRFGTVEDAGQMANDTEFGLVAGVWSRDVSTALELARTLQAGQVFINNYGVAGGVELPFGGYKKSGIGREKGLAALAEYTQLKNICIGTSSS